MPYIPNQCFKGVYESASLPPPAAAPRKKSRRLLLLAPGRCFPRVYRSNHIRGITTPTTSSKTRSACAISRWIMSCCGPAARSIHMRTAEKILSPRRASNVSTFQEIDWQAVKESGANSPSSAPPTAAMKPGRLVPDDTFKKYPGAADAGLQVGVYLYSQALNEAEAEEADYLLDLIRDYRSRYPVVYDQEEYSARSDADGRPERRTGDAERARFLPAHLQGRLLLAHDLCQYRLGAQYVRYGKARPLSGLVCGLCRQAPPFRAASPCGSIRTGRISGIEGPVDLNLLFLPAE